MRFTSLLTVALTFVGLVQSLPIESRAITSLNGVTYTARNADGSCQSASQIAASVKKMKASGISSIRTYAQQCEQLPTILKAIKANGGGMTVLAAVWIDGTSADNTEISTLKSVLSSEDTSAIEAILVGNEVVFGGIMSSSALAQKIKTVKAFAGSIPVGTAEIDSTYSKDLVAVSDIVGANIHPFFSDVAIGQAYNNLQTRYANFKKAAGGKPVKITETGWPSSGADVGAAVPSLVNAKSYANQVASSSLPYYYFEWQDSDWKSAGVESNFGILTAKGLAKFAV